MRFPHIEARATHLSQRPGPGRPTSREDDEEYSPETVGNYPLRYLRLRPDCEGVLHELRLRTGRTPPRRKVGPRWNMGRGEPKPAPQKGPNSPGTLMAVASQASHYGYWQSTVAVVRDYG
jgi:hypothetical protein